MKLERALLLGVAIFLPTGWALALAAPRGGTTHWLGELLAALACLLMALPLLLWLVGMTCEVLAAALRRSRR